MTDITLPSDTVLDEINGRALKLLGAIGSNRYIRAVYDQRGYSDATHQRGWELLHNASGYRLPATTQPIRSSPTTTIAIAEIDAWDEPNFRVARAALAVAFPAQCKFVFNTLEPQTGVGAIVSVTTFLDRLDELENSKDRNATRTADRAALAKLAERGITAKERARLRTLLETARSSPAPAPTPATDAKPAADPKSDAKELRAAKVELWGWYQEWSEVGKADIKRRDHLIQMGMGKRKKRAKKPPTGGEK